MSNASPSKTIATILALLVDPVAAEARVVSLPLQDGELVLAELYRLIDCDLVERAPFDDLHLIWTDEEYWDCATGLTVIDDSANAIVRRFLVIGATDDDEPCDVASDLPPILARFTCHRCIFEPEFETRSGDTGHGFIIQQRLKGTRPRIDRIRPALTTA
ncbi:MAG: hypothetical protein ACRCUE_16275 [Bosea sp. (in: a-proteobacteria)]